jgi:hypothetical protein
MYALPIQGCDLILNTRRVMSVFIDAQIKILPIKEKYYH